MSVQNNCCSNLSLPTVGFLTYPKWTLQNYVKVLLTFEEEMPLLFPILTLWAEAARGGKQRSKDLDIPTLFVFNMVWLHNFACIVHCVLFTSLWSHEYIVFAPYLANTEFAFLWKITGFWVNSVYYISKILLYLYLSFHTHHALVSHSFDIPYRRWNDLPPTPKMGKTPLNALMFEY